MSLALLISLRGGCPTTSVLKTSLSGGEHEKISSQKPLCFACISGRIEVGKQVTGAEHKWAGPVIAIEKVCIQQAETETHRVLTLNFCVAGVVALQLSGTGSCCPAGVHQGHAEA